ncbi:MAG: hypothetical protein GY855_14525 [candidate division Zixibacteria bacterium]|nr:hypothetical protein [candidate division Zixibacteria bacterium]
MNNRHLSDAEIQNYLDGEYKGDLKRFKIHIRNCEYCRNELAKYKELYSDLKNGVDYERYAFNN